MPEFNILQKAGLSQRKDRENIREVTPELKEIAERLDFLFYDGERKFGCGGYVYDGRWKAIAEIIKERYNLSKDSRVLIDRCNKGFLVYDLKKLIPGITVYGIMPAKYPLNQAMDGYGNFILKNRIKEGNPKLIEQKAKAEIMPFLIQGKSNKIPFKDNYFDTVISIENACAYPEEECRKVIKEIIRITKDNGKKSYIQNDSWTNEHEKKILLKWTVLCKTFLDTKGWEKLFQEEGYNGDWGFTIIT